MQSSDSVEKATPPKEELPAASRKKFEHVWKAGFVLVGLATAVVMKKVELFQTMPEFDSVRRGSSLDFLLYSLPFAVVFTLFDLLVHYLLDDLCAKHYITEERYTEPEAKRKRCYTLVKWFYSIFYYFASSVWAYTILRQTAFMPVWLGGQGSTMTIIRDVPLMPDASTEMKVFYVLQAGKHFSRFFSHVFIRPEGAFFEYALHHGLSVFLIVFSYLCNQWLVGVFVLMIHDYSDFALITARMYKDYKNVSKFLRDVTYVHAIISWVGCRIILFSTCCIYPTWMGAYFQGHDCYKDEVFYNVLRMPYTFLATMLTALLVMQLFWTYYIVESFLAVKVSTKLARHTYD